MKNKYSDLNLTRSMMCPVCQSGNVSPFLEISDLPVHIGLLLSSKKFAKQCPKGNINLGFCAFCGFITNLSFCPPLLKYNQGYENSLHFSPHFQDYARSLANELVERYDLFEKDIISIGCGDGYFLSLLCELGKNRGIGFDPGCKDIRCNRNKLLNKNITLINDYYSAKYTALKVDFISCRHVLEHMHNPTNFLSELRFILGDRVNTAVHFEVPNVRFILNSLSIWDIIYEHCSYFSLESLATAFTLCGLQICRLRETYDGQNLAIEALPNERRSATQQNNGGAPKDIAREIINFSDKYHQKLVFWEERLDSLENSGQKVVLWGAGAKGVSFLNMLKIKNQIKYVVDVNPRKQGKYIAGTGQQIVSPDFLIKYQPDIIIIANQIYQNEIRRIVKIGRAHV